MGLATPKNLLRYPEDFLRYPGRIELCGGIVPRARPVLSSGVAGVKPGFVGNRPVFGAVVMELAAMTHVPDKHQSHTTVKPIEVSFIWYFLYRFR